MSVLEKVENTIAKLAKKDITHKAVGEFGDGNNDTTATAARSRIRHCKFCLQ